MSSTLDPTLRRLDLPEGGALVLADTVGFISKRPHELVAAFKSTLQETVEADLLMHVVDAASHCRAENMAEVEDVLSQIAADTVPRLEVFNKIDLLEFAEPRLERDGDGVAVRVWCSAQTGAGMELLVEALQERFHQTHVKHNLRLSPADGRVRAILYQNARVLHEAVLDDGGSELEVEFTLREFQRLLKLEQGFADLVLF